MNVTVIGTGYVGSVTGACLAYLGHHVTCVDNDQVKIEKWKRGACPLYEPHLEEIVDAALACKRIEFTTVLGDAVRNSDVIFIAVGTPALANGSANLSYLESAARSIGAALDGSRFRVVVNKSTVPVGCGNLVETLLREGVCETNPLEHQKVQFSVASNPEFLREGSAVEDSLYPDRIVVGASDSRSLEILYDLYRPVLDQSFSPPPSVPRPPSISSVPFVSTSVTSAEMIKYGANAFLAMKIGFANEMARICEHVGADVIEVMQGIGLDSRIGGKFLKAGIGWGGSCFGKDIRTLLQTAREYGYNSRLLQATLEVNAAQREMVIQKLQEKLFILKGRTIGLLGLAFKPETDDLRDAPSLHIAERLLSMGARVKAYDPVAIAACRQNCPALKIRYCDSAYQVAQDADALVAVTEWKEFENLRLEELAPLMKTPVLIDGRNIFRPELAVAAGFDYTTIGRAVLSSLRTDVATRSGACPEPGARSRNTLDRLADGSPSLSRPFGSDGLRATAIRQPTS